MTPTFPIKKRINTELFIERTTALYFYQERLEREMKVIIDLAFSD